MGTRRTCRNLSMTTKSESPKTPNGDRTRSSAGECDRTSSSCSTPVNRKTYSVESSPAYDNDNALSIPMSQDNCNLVTGVAWAWNSPKRTIPYKLHNRQRPLISNICNRDPDSSSGYRKKTVKKLKGFYKFQSELKLMKELEENQSKLEKQESNTSLKVHVPTSPPQSPGGENHFIVSYSSMGKSSSSKTSTILETDERQSDSFNDSELDKLLLKASQTAETDVKPCSLQKSSKKRSFFKRHTSADSDSFSHNLLNDSDLDIFLVEASQMAEREILTINSDEKISTRKSSLMRHKSLPISPSLTKSGGRSMSATTRDVQGSSSESEKSSSTDASAIIMEPNIETVVVSSSSVETISSRNTPSEDKLPRQCTKEEIELKRQEALKRQQASRLRRIMKQDNKLNHLKSVTTKK